MEGTRSKLLPPGFRFDPTDEELPLYFLHRKIASLPPCNSAVIIPVLHHLPSPSDPWDLTTEEAVLSQNKWYFFSRVDENRWTKSGHWEDLDVNEPILQSGAGNVIGMKKYFVFFKKEVPKDVQTNWIMEEYHLSQSTHKQTNQRDLEEWVLCRVQESSINCDSQGMSCVQSNGDDDDDDDDELSLLDEVFLALDDDQEEEINFPY